MTVTPRRRFDEDVLAFSDPDGIPLEIVGVAVDPRQGWTGDGLSAEHAIRGLHTAELTVRAAGPTEDLLTTVMGWSFVRRDGIRARFTAGVGGPGHFVDVIADPSAPQGTGGAGTVHHIAFRVADDAAELAMQARIAHAGYPVSDVRDRDYFRSIYYRERGGILFEIATDTPGFAVDEEVGALGQTLQLPRQFRSARSRIETLLPPLHAARRYA